MLNDQRPSTSYESQDDREGEEELRDIHALTPPHVNRPRRMETWETSSHRSTSTSTASMEGVSTENFTTMSRDFSALVLAGSTIGRSSNNDHENYELGINGLGSHNLERIGEEDSVAETNPLAIVPDNNPLQDPVRSPRPRGLATGSSSSSSITTAAGGEVSLLRVKKEEVESKISAWQNAKIAKINNRFKREEAIINGSEGEQVQKAQSWMKKVERKLEEKRAKVLEKMQNKVAKAHRKAEERRASAEAKRGTKVARVIEVANLMRAVGRAPEKRSFF